MTTSPQSITINTGGGFQDAIVGNLGNIVMAVIVAAVLRYMDVSWMWTFIVAGIFFVVISGIGGGM